MSGSRGSSTRSRRCLSPWRCARRRYPVPPRCGIGTPREGGIKRPVLRIIDEPARGRISNNPVDPPGNRAIGDQGKGGGLGDDRAPVVGRRVVEEADAVAHPVEDGGSKDGMVFTVALSCGEGYDRIVRVSVGRAAFPICCVLEALHEGEDVRDGIAVTVPDVRDVARNHSATVAMIPSSPSVTTNSAIRCGLSSYVPWEEETNLWWVVPGMVRSITILLPR